MRLRCSARLRDEERRSGRSEEVPLQFEGLPRLDVLSHSSPWLWDGAAVQHKVCGSIEWLCVGGMESYILKSRSIEPIDFLASAPEAMSREHAK